MGNPLRDRRTAVEWASLGQVIEITDKIGSFESLAAIVSADLAALDAAKMPSQWRDLAVRGELRFGFANAAALVPTLIGQARATVAAVCQRCLEPFLLTLRIAPRLLLLAEDEAVDGVEDFEVWELQDGQLQPAEVLEELLIMALPFSAMHDNMAECKALAATADNAEEVKRPFADLRSQMQQNEQDPNR